MRRIDIVLFDLDDTLHDDTYAYQSAAEEVAREVAAEQGVDALALKDAYIAQAEGFWSRLARTTSSVSSRPACEPVANGARQRRRGRRGAGRAQRAAL